MITRELLENYGLNDDEAIDAILGCFGAEKVCNMLCHSLDECCAKCQIEFDDYLTREE